MLSKTMSRRQYYVAFAVTDAAHRGLVGSGSEVFGKMEYTQLAGISVSHIYNLHGSTVYRRYWVTVHRIEARQVSIAKRRKPYPGTASRGKSEETIGSGSKTQDPLV